MKALVLSSVASFGLTLALLAQTPTPEAPTAAPVATSTVAPVAVATVPPPTIAPIPTATVAVPANPTVRTSPNDFADDIKRRVDRNFRHKGRFGITIDGDHEGSDKARHHDSDDFPHALVPIALISILGVFGAPVLIVALIMYFSMSKSRALQRTVRMMVEKGQPVPPELLASPAAAPLRPWYDLRRGIILLAVGVGVVMFFGLAAGWDEGVWALGLIPALIGLGYILAWRLANKQSNGLKL